MYNLKQDVVFIDPPWGGKNYKSKKNLDLFLSNINIIKILNNKFPNMPVERVDERFTSKMAFQTMIASGINKNKRKNKSLVDEISATIILQSYLANK